MFSRRYIVLFTEYSVQENLSGLPRQNSAWYLFVRVRVVIARRVGLCACLCLCVHFMNLGIFRVLNLCSE